MAFPLQAAHNIAVSCPMDYRARGSWIGNARGRPGKAGYGGSDVTFNNFHIIHRGAK